LTFSKVIEIDFFISKYKTIEHMQALRNWLNGSDIGRCRSITEVLLGMKVDWNVQTKVEGELVLFNYDDDAPRGNQVVDGCRGSIWRHTESGWVCCRAPMDRFYNYGEASAPVLPDLSTIQFQEKKDGTLVILWFHPFLKKWIWGTRNTFDLSTIPVAGRRNFQDVINAIPGISGMFEHLDTTKTYMFEGCTPFNVVVIVPNRSSITFLTARSTLPPFQETNGDEISSCFPRPDLFRFETIDECREYVNSRDPTKFEGLVLIRRENGTVSRWKVKSSGFLSLAHTSKTSTPPPELIIMALLKKDLPELVATNPEWSMLATKIEAKFVEYKNQIKKTDDALVPQTPPRTKKEEADVINTSVCPTYHFARSKYANIEAFLLKEEPIRVLEMIGAQSLFV
jgi:hypothetical protein